MANPVKEMIGRRFGRFVVLAMAERDRDNRIQWRVRCDCGEERVVRGAPLRGGKSLSCGCARSILYSMLRTTHGAATYRPDGSHNNVEYRIWNNMKERCFNPNDHGFTNYGARGISVCDRWRHDFAAFLADMGPRPSPKHSIDRIDNDKWYSPDNCRWATKKEQSRNTRRNTRLTLSGVTRTAIEWAEVLGLKYETILYRLSVGMSAEEALTLPAGHRRPATRRAA